MQHRGIAARLMQEAIDYADSHRMMISLETHNEKNVEFYKNLGFKVYGIMKQKFPAQAILYDPGKFSNRKKRDDPLHWTVPFPSVFLIHRHQFCTHQCGIFLCKISGRLPSGL